MNIQEFYKLLINTFRPYLASDYINSYNYQNLDIHELYSDRLNEMIMIAYIDYAVLEVFEYKLSRAVKPLKINFNISWCDTIEDIYYNHFKQEMR